MGLGKIMGCFKFIFTFIFYIYFSSLCFFFTPSIFGDHIKKEKKTNLVIFYEKVGKFNNSIFLKIYPIDIL